MKGSSILVTGGAGYIGSHVCKTLARAGALPITLDNLVHGHREAVRWGPFVQGDLADADLLTRVIERYRVQAVVHLAAYAYVGESMHAPERYFRNNVMNSMNLLEVLLRTDVRTCVFSSTCATYGHPQRLPIEEAHPQQPVNPYGESKLFVERALRWYESAHGLRSVALRYFNAAGADPDGDIGETHDPETHLVPLAIEAALGLRPHLELYGTDYPTPDGTAVRDYIHVSDLADAHVRALGYLLAGGSSTALNLGTGRGHSVREVIAAVERVAGATVPVRERPRRPGDPAVLLAGANRAIGLLDWRSQHSSMDAIVDSAWRWRRSRTDARARTQPNTASSRLIGRYAGAAGAAGAVG